MVHRICALCSSPLSLASSFGASSRLRCALEPVPSRRSQPGPFAVWARTANHLCTVRTNVEKGDRRSGRSGMRQPSRAFGLWGSLRESAAGNLLYETSKPVQDAADSSCACGRFVERWRTQVGNCEWEVHATSRHPHCTGSAKSELSRCAESAGTRPAGDSTVTPIPISRVPVPGVPDASPTGLEAHPNIADRRKVARRRAGKPLALAPRKPQTARGYSVARPWKGRAMGPRARGPAECSRAWNVPDPLGSWPARSCVGHMG